MATDARILDEALREIVAAMRLLKDHGQIRGKEVEVRLRSWFRKAGEARVDRSTRRGVISLSVPVLSKNPGILRNIVLHELAHLIVGVRHQHGPKWKQAARDLGIEPYLNCFEMGGFIAPDDPHTIYCPTCAVIVKIGPRRSLWTQTKKAVYVHACGSDLTSKADTNLLDLCLTS